MRAMLLATGAAAMLFVAGCAGVKSKSDAGPPASKAALEAKPWRLQSLAGLEPAKLAAIESGVSVRFAGGNVQISTGCNQMRGGYALDAEGVLTVKPLAGTMVACPEPAATVENAVKKAFSVPLHTALANGRLTLEPENEGATMVLAPEPPPRIEGVAWNVAFANDGRKAMVSVVRGTTLTLSFANGTVSGSAGCNTFRGSYKLQGDRIAIGQLSTTRKACPGDGVMKQEANYVAALQNAATWKVERGLLTLFGADGNRLVEAQGPASRP